MLFVGSYQQAWSYEGTNVVENAVSGKCYDSIDAAVREARPDDKLIILKDVVVLSPISFDNPIQIDLSGHKLSLKLPERGVKAETSLIAITGSGNSRISNGSISVKESTPVLPASATFDLKAISVEKGASLGLINVQIDVTYECDESTTNSPNITGLYINQGKATFGGSSRIEIEALGQYPANVFGVSISASSAVEGEVFSQEPSTKISIVNHTKRAQTGEINKDENLTSINIVYLMEFYPEKESSLYEEIQKRFLQKAKLDSANDVDGKVNDADIYYAAPMKLRDQHYIWAFSNPKAEEDVGKHSKITADRIFGQSRYEKMPETVAVSLRSDVGSKAKAVFSGKIEAMSDDGESFCLDPNTYAKATISSTANLSASGTKNPYRKVAGAISAASLTGKQALAGKFYPSAQSKAYEVKWVKPVSSCIRKNEDNIAVDSGANLGDVDSGNEPNKVESLPETETVLPSSSDKAQIRFYYYQLLGSDTVYTYSQSNLYKGSSLNDLANSYMHVNDVVYKGDKVETFKGWSTRRSDKDVLDKDGFPIAAEDANYYAIYETRDRRISVNFIVDGRVYSRAADVLASKIVDFAFKASDNNAKPGMDKSGNAFRGWSLKPGGKPVTHLVKKLMDLATAEEPLNLYAVYYKDSKGSNSGNSNSGSKKNSNETSSKLKSPSTNTSSSIRNGLAKLKPTLKATTKSASDEGQELVPVEGEESAYQADSDVGFGDVGTDETISGGLDGEVPTSGGDQFPGSNSDVFGPIFVIGAALMLLGTGVWSAIRNRRFDKEGDYFDPAIEGSREIRF